MTDKNLYVFNSNISSFTDFIEKHKKYICTDIFWDEWKSSKLFYFGFDTLPKWYLDLIIELNELFDFLEIDVCYEIKNIYTAENPLDCFYSIFNIKFDEEVSESLQKQYTYIIQTIIRTVTLSRMKNSRKDYISLIEKINNNEKTIRLYLLIGMSNLIRKQNRNLYSGIMNMPILKSLAVLEKAEIAYKSFGYLKQSNFIRIMKEDEIKIPSKGDTVYVFGKMCVIDIVFSLDFIKVISLEDGQAQFCAFNNIRYEKEI